jgi:hypothetical protein
MTVLQMLAEVIGPEELLRSIAFSELVHILQVTDPFLPVLIGGVPSLIRPLREAGSCKLFTAIAARVSFSGASCAVMKRSRVACKSRARPAVPADMERVLVALSFVVVLKTITAV